jgi:hypothetical protein
MLRCLRFAARALKARPFISPGHSPRVDPISAIPIKPCKGAGYIIITKQFKDNKPLTTAAITLDGRKALARYLDEMQTIISALKPANSAG